MVELVFARCDDFARFAGAACLNALLPSIIVVAVAFLLTRFKAWNSASRYLAWWLTLFLVVLLPFALLLFRPAAKSIQGTTVVRHHSLPERIAAAPNVKPASTRPSSPSGAALLFLLYGAVLLTQLSRLAFALLASLRLKRRASRPQNSPMAARFATLLAIMRVRRAVSFAFSDQIDAPVAIGYWKPSILLPKALATQLDMSETEQVLAHELAHIRRYDDWSIAIQKLIQAVFVFHPLVHLIARRLDLDREISCDDYVISSHQPRSYAACLTKIAELVEFGPPMTLTLPLLARKSHLAARVEFMLDRTRAHMPRISLRRVLPFATVAFLSACFGLRAPALIALPAQSATPSKPVPVASGPTSSIAITSQSGSTTTFVEGSNMQIEHSPFPHGSIVFERNGSSYIIRDHATVTAALELLRPQEELSRQQEALSAQQEKLGELQEQLGRHQEALSNPRLDAAATRDLENQLRDLGAKLRSIDLEKSVKTASDAQERIAELQERLGQIQSRIGDEQGKVGEAQGQLGEQQGRLGEQQGHLGEQQGKLGEQQAREAKRAEEKLRELIKRAEAQGLAQPLR